MSCSLRPSISSGEPTPPNSVRISDAGLCVEAGKNVERVHGGDRVTTCCMLMAFSVCRSSHSCPSFLLFIDLSTVNYSYIVISDRVLVCSSLLWDPNAYSILLNK